MSGEDCIRPGEAESSAEWLGSFCARFGKRFAAVFGEYPAWRWTLDQTLQPMVVVTGPNVQLGRALPDRYYQLPPMQVADELWQDFSKRIEAVGHLSRPSAHSDP